MFITPNTFVPLLWLGNDRRRELRGLERLERQHRAETQCGKKALEILSAIRAEGLRISIS